MARKKDSQYIEFSIKTAVAILASLSFNDIRGFRTSVVNFESVLLSQISNMNNTLKDILDNSTNIVCNNYIDDLQKKVDDINKFTMSVDDVYLYKDFVNKIHDKITEYLSEELNKDEVKYNGVLSFLFTHGERDSLTNKTMTPIRYDANQASKFQTYDESTKNTFIEGIQLVINDFCDKMQSVIDMEKEVSSLVYSTSIAFYIWFKICNSNNDKLSAYLNKEFRDIRIEILDLIEKGEIV